MSAIVLLLAVVACGEGRTLQDRPPFQSLKSPAETIRNYEVHIPILRNGGEGSDEHPRNIDIKISKYTFHLEKNFDLVASHFTSQYYDANGNEIIEKGHMNCFYHGEVEDHPDWHIAVSTCHGLHGSFGEVGNKENYYHVEPLDQTETTIQQPHVLYLTKEYTKINGTCGTPHSTHQPHLKSQAPVIPSPQINLDRDRVRRRVNGFYIVEWAMINDLAQYNAYGRNLSAVVLRDLEIANFVDSLYRTLSVRVVVVHVITWTTRDRIPYPSDNDPDPLLNNLREYEPQITPVHDSTMLITGVNILGNTVGIAFIGTMCGRSSVGLSQDGGRSLEGVGSTTAHELGHIFSMSHDDSPRVCTCNDPSMNCIMAASSGFPSPVEWSTCSREDIMNGFTQENLNSCLGNEPQTTVGDPVCGNGIRERDEICDCGTIEECTDPCCNATSCGLMEGAVCSQGDCCTENCQFRPLGTTCRALSQDSLGCDILEYCSGESSDCPRDVYLQDGQICNDGNSYCYAGICQIPDNKCQKFFGSGNAIPECYSVYNILGTGPGNCGFSRDDFVACAPEHAQCGQLQCASGSFIGRVSVAITIYTRSTQGVLCRSFTSAPNSDVMSPGLVPDGTYCGNGSFCVSQSCSMISELDYIQACPVGQNGITCAGTGVCNNLNQCSCIVGRGGTNCETIVEVVAAGKGGVIAGAIIGVILGLVLIAGVTVGVILLVTKLQKKKKSYLPPVRNQTTSNKSHLNTTSVNVVRPSTSKANSKVYKPPPYSKSLSPPPPAYNPGVGQAAPSRPPPPHQRPTPSKVTPLTDRSARVAPPSQKPPPPQNRNKPPPAAAPKPGKIQKQWPPSSEKPLPPPTKKPVFPPRKY